MKTVLSLTMVLLLAASCGQTNDSETKVDRSEHTNARIVQDTATKLSRIYKRPFRVTDNYGWDAYELEKQHLFDFEKFMIQSHPDFESVMNRLENVLIFLSSEPGFRVNTGGDVGRTGGKVGAGCRTELYIGLGKRDAKLPPVWKKHTTSVKRSLEYILHVDQKCHQLANAMATNLKYAENGRDRFSFQDGYQTAFGGKNYDDIESFFVKSRNLFTAQMDTGIRVVTELKDHFNSDQDYSNLEFKIYIPVDTDSKPMYDKFPFRGDEPGQLISLDKFDVLSVNLLYHYDDLAAKIRSTVGSR